MPGFMTLPVSDLGPDNKPLTTDRAIFDSDTTLGPTLPSGVPLVTIAFSEPSVAFTLPAVTAQPIIGGLSAGDLPRAVLGSTLTLTPATFSPAVTDAMTYRLTSNGAEIPGDVTFPLVLTQGTYLAYNDTVVTVRQYRSGVLVAESLPARFARPAPAVTGSLTISVSANTGVQTFPIGSYFDKPGEPYSTQGLTFVASSSVLGITFNAVTATISVDTAATGVMSGVSYPIRGFNSGGEAILAVSANVSLPAADNRVLSKATATTETGLLYDLTVGWNAGVGENTFMLVQGYYDGATYNTQPLVALYDVAASNRYMSLSFAGASRRNTAGNAIASTTGAATPAAGWHTMSALFASGNQRFYRDSETAVVQTSTSSAPNTFASLLTKMAIGSNPAGNTSGDDKSVNPLTRVLLGIATQAQLEAFHAWVVAGGDPFNYNFAGAGITVLRRVRGSRNGSIAMAGTDLGVIEEIGSIQPTLLSTPAWTALTPAWAPPATGVVAESLAASISAATDNVINLAVTLPVGGLWTATRIINSAGITVSGGPGYGAISISSITSSIAGRVCNLVLNLSRTAYATETINLSLLANAISDSAGNGNPETLGMSVTNNSDVPFPGGTPSVKAIDDATILAQRNTLVAKHGLGVNPVKGFVGIADTTGYTTVIATTADQLATALLTMSNPATLLEIVCNWNGLQNYTASEVFNGPGASSLVANPASDTGYDHPTNNKVLIRAGAGFTPILGKAQGGASAYSFRFIGFGTIEFRGMRFAGAITLERKLSHVVRPLRTRLAAKSSIFEAGLNYDCETAHIEDCDFIGGTAGWRGNARTQRAWNVRSKGKNKASDLSASFGYLDAGYTSWEIDIWWSGVTVYDVDTTLLTNHFDLFQYNVGNELYSKMNILHEFGIYDLNMPGSQGFFADDSNPTILPERNILIHNCIMTNRAWWAFVAKDSAGTGFVTLHRLLASRAGTVSEVTAARVVLSGLRAGVTPVGRYEISECYSNSISWPAEYTAVIDRANRGVSLDPASPLYYPLMFDTNGTVVINGLGLSSYTSPTAGLSAAAARTAMRNFWRPQVGYQGIGCGPIDPNLWPAPGPTI